MQRRTFLALGGTLLSAAALGGWTVSHATGNAPLLLSARNDSNGNHYATGHRLDGVPQFVTRVPARCHDVCVHPGLPLALFVGRRPGRESYLVDTRDGRLLQTVTTPEHRHFQGHAVFHRSGEWLYSTENDTQQPGRGVLGVWRWTNGHLERAGEQSTHGVGPHQLLWMPDGESLVVANGGIRTEADSRANLNLDAMEPSLVLVHRSGELLSKETLPEPMNSIRHLAVARDGTLVSGQQYEGDPSDTVPLIAIKRPGQALQAFPLEDAQRRAMNQYTASLAIHSERRLLAITAPRGNRFFIWALDSGELRHEATFADCAGVAACAEGFVVSSGQGRCQLFDCRGSTITSQWLKVPAAFWDNHWRLV